MILRVSKCLAAWFCESLCVFRVEEWWYTHQHIQLRVSEV